ncbi:hypothetical protein ACRRTK_022238 [Alexandromys fortis]
MEQPEDMASLSEFDSLAGSIPATKVEITVSCRSIQGTDVDTLHEKYLLWESSQRLASGLTLVAIPP